MTDVIQSAVLITIYVYSVYVAGKLETEEDRMKR